MGGLFGGSQPSMAQTPPSIHSVKIQQSAYGLCIPIVYGTNRLAGDVIWLGKTQAIPHTSNAASGGKGGAPKMTNTTWTYTVPVAVALCEGPIAGLGAHWRNKKRYATSGEWSVHLGALTQAPEPWLTAHHPDAALVYPGQAYVFKSALDCGSSANLPNISFEVKGFLIIGSGNADAFPPSIIVDYLTNAQYGVGFNAALLGSLTQFQNYCNAAGIYISPILSEQKTIADALQDVLTVSNTRAVYSGGVLNFVPMGDAPLNGNGAAYTPNLTPVANITDDDLASAASGSGSGTPISVQRKDQAQANNDVRVEYLDRSHDYNTAIAEARDDASVAFYGLRAQSTIQAHGITKAPIAQFLAQLTVQQNLANLNTYTFTLSPRWILLDPLDIITLTDSRIGLYNTPVRLTEIDEQPDGTFQCTAEDLSLGSYTVEGFGTEPLGGYIPNTEVAPPDCAAPVIWEPPPAYTGDKRHICIATAGQIIYGTLAVASGVATFTSTLATAYAANQLQGCSLQDSAGIIWPIIGNAATSSNATVLTLLPGAATPATGAAAILPDTWGGCNVWVSDDNSTYKQIGTLMGPSRYGALTATLAASANVFPTADTADTLSVDLGVSLGAMYSGTQADADELRTLVYCDGEYLAYETATLVSGSAYTLSYLQRGAFSTTAGAHAIGAPFAVVDDALGTFKYKLEAGKTLYVKLQSFNCFGNAPQDLSTLTPYTYGVQGVAAPAAPTLTLEECKLRRDLWLASWPANAALRHLVIARMPFSAYVSGSTPDTDPTNWSHHHVIPLATPQADGSLSCDRTHIKFTVAHVQGQHECVAGRLTTPHGKSTWAVNTGTAPGSTDGTPPANVSVTSVSFSEESVPGSTGHWFDCSIGIKWDGQADRVVIKWQNGSNPVRHHHATISSAPGSTGNVDTINLAHHFKKGKQLSIWVQAFNIDAGSGFIAAPANPYTVGSAIGGIAGTITVTRTETKLRRNLYTAAWSGLNIANADLRYLKVYKNGVHLKKLHLSSPGADGDQTCTITTIDFWVDHTQGASISVGIQLEDCEGQLSAVITDAGSAPGGSDDTPPATPSLGTGALTTSLVDQQGNPTKRADLTCIVTIGNTDRVRVNAQDLQTGKAEWATVECLTTDTSATLYWPDIWKRGDTVQIMKIVAYHGTSQVIVEPAANNTIVAGGSLPAVTDPTVALVTSDSVEPDIYQVSFGATNPDLIKLQVCKSTPTASSPDLTRKQPDIDCLDYTADPPVCDQSLFEVDLHHASNAHPKIWVRAVTRYGKGSWVAPGSAPPPSSGPPAPTVVCYYDVAGSQYVVTATWPAGATSAATVNAYTAAAGTTTNPITNPAGWTAISPDSVVPTATTATIYIAAASNSAIEFAVCITDTDGTVGAFTWLFWPGGSTAIPKPYDQPVSSYASGVLTATWAWAGTSPTKIVTLSAPLGTALPAVFTGAVPAGWALNPSTSNPLAIAGVQSQVIQFADAGGASLTCIAALSLNGTTWGQWGRLDSTPASPALPTVQINKVPYLGQIATRFSWTSGSLATILDIRWANAGTLPANTDPTAPPWYLFASIAVSSSMSMYTAVALNPTWNDVAARLTSGPLVGPWTMRPAG